MEGFFWRIFLAEFFLSNFLGEIFWEDFLGGFFKRIFGRIFLRGILREEFFVYVGLSRFCLNAEGRKGEFRSLEVQRKLIALKNGDFMI